MTLRDLPAPWEIYARILRAAERNEGVRLSADECSALWMDTAAVDSALGGTGETPDTPWLTPTERRRVEAGEWGQRVFRPGRDVDGAES